MKYKLTLLLLAFTSYIVLGQGATKRALFLGNSYIGVNNLHQMTANVAASVGDTLIVDSVTPGGHTLQGHSANATSLAKIAQGNWDFVVLQEQSQRPSFPIGQVEEEVFPYAAILDSLINAQNPCAETVFYVTWGRKDGDSGNCANWPPVCTYAGMDSLLNLRYRMMAESNDAILAPVGQVWRHLRQNYPFLELYAADGSHPSVAGSFAAACCFYTVMFRKDPTNVTYNPGLLTFEALTIMNAVRQVVYEDFLEWHVGAYDPTADFTFTNNGSGNVSFVNTSTYADAYMWSFGDSSTSSDESPIHTFQAAGSYNVMLIAESCGYKDTIVQMVNTTALALPSDAYGAHGINLYPNPVSGALNLEPAVNGAVQFKIINMEGRVVSEGTSTELYKIDVSKLFEGVYLLEVFRGNQLIVHERFVKQK